MDLINKEETKAWDLYTIRNEKIDSIDLMERASETFVRWFTSLYFDKFRKISVIAGCGNNGGDALAVARLLRKQGYQVRVHYMKFSDSASHDNKLNLSKTNLACIYINFQEIFFESNEIIIDGLLGTGIKGEVLGEYAKLIDFVNSKDNEVISIDIPSGLEPDGHEGGAYMIPTRVLSFECPKISFFTEHLNWSSRSIGLRAEYLKEVESDFKFISRVLAQSIIRKRSPASSKYQFGFGQFCGASPGMLGAVILAAKAAMRCGLGRLSVSIPQQYESAFLISCPEAMVQSGIVANQKQLTNYELLNHQVSVLAAGPGMGTSEESIHFIDDLLATTNQPIVLDADALNIISKMNWQSRFPKNCIITPHEKEFERLFGVRGRRWDKVKFQREKSIELGITIVLKGANTSISTPEGKCYFNNTGNVGLATAGSGDVLTGMIFSFLGQGYSTLESSILGVYLHGLSGDNAKLEYGVVSLVASDIIQFLPEVIKNLYGE